MPKISQVMERYCVETVFAAIVWSPDLSLKLLADCPGITLDFILPRACQIQSQQERKLFILAFSRMLALGYPMMKLSDYIALAIVVLSKLKCIEEKNQSRHLKLSKAGSKSREPPALSKQSVSDEDEEDSRDSLPEQGGGTGD